MTAIPAQVAGVERIVVVSPKPAPETLAAAHLLGITEFYRLGGAHAIAALAYGTETIARVDKIVGPGNLYVTAAKRLVAFDCAIDMLAGPTEIVVTSERGDAADIASDLVAQAEHDPEALAIFVTTRADLARAVAAEVKRCEPQPTRSRANPSLAMAPSSSRLAWTKLTTSPTALPPNTSPSIPPPISLGCSNAGSVFVGRWSAQPLGDYISGPNHTLPTGGMARVRGGLSVNDFVKLITVQEYTAQGVRSLGPSRYSLGRSRRPHRPRRGNSHAARQQEISCLNQAPCANQYPALRVQAMKEYHPPLGDRDVLRLDFNENTLACSPKVREVLGRISAGELTRYPEREPVEAIVADASRSRARTGRCSPTASTKPFTFSSRPSSMRATSCFFPCPLTPCTRSTLRRPTRSIVAVQSAADLQFPFERLLAAITPADQDHRHRQSQQPIRFRRHTRATHRNRTPRTARRRARR